MTNPTDVHDISSIVAQRQYDELLELYTTTEELKKRFKERYIDFVMPDTGPYSRDKYQKALEFYKAGKNHRFRLLTGVNGSGKSFTLALECNFHWTGEYPAWWEGVKQENPQHWWIIAKSAGTFKSSLQRILLGNSLDEDNLGSGLIPKQNIVSISHFPGPSGVVGEIKIRHKLGHIVTVELKVDTQDEKNIQAANLDGILFDEEPSDETYTEAVFRLRGTPIKPPGISLMGFTAWQGLTKVIQKYLVDGKYPGPDETGGPHPEDKEKYIVSIGLKDVPHLTETDRQAYLRDTPPNQIEARIYGKVATGSGQIYPFPETQVFCEPFEIPEYFPRAFAIDFGWHNTAVIWGAMDPRTHVIYIYAEYLGKEQTTQINALNIKARGEWIPGICDPSGGGVNTANGKLLRQEYNELGIKLVAGDNAIQAGLAKVANRFQNGTLKIFNFLIYIKKEYRMYRYDSKDPNKPAPNQDDHFMDTLKYLVSKFEYTAKTYEQIKRRHLDNNYKSSRKNASRDPITGY